MLASDTCLDGKTDSGHSSSRLSCAYIAVIAVVNGISVPGGWCSECCASIAAGLWDGDEDAILLQAKSNTFGIAWTADSFLSGGICNPGGKQSAPWSASPPPLPSDSRGSVHCLLAKLTASPFAPHLELLLCILHHLGSFAFPCSLQPDPGSCRTFPAGDHQVPCTPTSKSTSIFHRTLLTSSTVAAPMLRHWW